MGKNKKGTEKMRCGSPSRDKLLPSLTSQKEENNGRVSGAVLGTIHNPLISSSQICHKKSFNCPPPQVRGKTLRFQESLQLPWGVASRATG